MSDGDFDELADRLWVDAGLYRDRWMRARRVADRQERARQLAGALTQMAEFFGRATGPDRAGD